MSVNLSPIGTDAPFVDSNGDPLNGGKLYTYTAGSSTPQTTYTTSAGNVQNANPIVLGSTGYPTSGGSVVAIWLTAGVSYKFILENAAGTVLWTRDNISGINDTTVTIDQWVSGPAPTYISATSFTLSGDQTSTFHVGRRIRTTNSGGTIYSTITASAYGALTTVTVANDSGTLDSGLSAVSYGLLSKDNDSMPRGIFPTLANVSKHIYGLTFSNNVSDATNDVDFAAGGAMSSDGAMAMTLSSVSTKRIDAAWAAGTGNGGLMSAAALTNQVYGLWLIGSPTTGAVDIGFDASLTAPTLPSGYTKSRLIGWIQRVAGALRAVTITETGGGGIRVQHSTPPIDVDSTALTTSRLLSTLASAPIGIKVQADLSMFLGDAGGAIVNVRDPDETDAAPSASAAPGIDVNISAGTGSALRLQVFTNTSGQIAARASAAVDNYRVFVVGYEWGRR